jgi:hypothetical protein
MFRQASEFTGIHKKLGVLVDPYLNESWSLADIGCGLALIDFELAASVRSVTAIDTDESALADVERHIDEELAAGRKDAGKITTLRMDAAELGRGGERWDVVLLSFFGASVEETGRLLGLADHRGIILMHGQDAGNRFDPIATPEKVERSAEKIEEYLKNGNYGYRRSDVELQFGQPFRTLTEIHEFLESYEMDPDGVALLDGAAGYAPDDNLDAGDNGYDAERLMYSIEDRIIKTRRYDFPYYLPRNLRIAIFIVATGR